MEGLENRFGQFMDSLNRVENIDDLFDEKDGCKKADYLWCNRAVVVELKTLKTDPEIKAQTEMDKHSERDDYPLFYGEVDSDKIINQLHDGKEIRRKIYLKITRSLEDIVRSSEKQIKATKKSLSLFESIGLLVILNDTVRILSPEIIVRRVSHLLHRKDDSGDLKYRNIGYVWLIQENYELEIECGTASPLILIEGLPTHNTETFEECFNKIQEQWVKFNNASIFVQNIDEINEIKFNEKKSKGKEELLTNQDLWKKKYQSQPYLRELSDKDVLAHGARVFEYLLPYFMKDGPKKSNIELEEQMIGWSDFLEEARFRGLNLKNIPIEKLNKQVKRT